MSGWVKLHRKILDWEWKNEPETLALFIHLLLTANYQNTKWRGISIGKGQILTGRKKLSDETGLSQRSVRTSLTRLKSTNELTIKTTSKYSIITITNWHLYQESDQQEANERPTNDQQTTTSKNIRNKEYKENKNIIFTSPRKSADTKKGSRLPEDWKCQDTLGEWAMDQGLSREEVITEIHKFRDYWTAKAGKGAIKLNWDSTFRNWIRNHMERKK